MKNILVFGSLRKTSSRGTNFGRLGEQKFIKEIVLDGYEMFSFDVCPTICEGDGKVKCELHEVEDDTYVRIVAMEMNAGYSAKNVTVDGVKATLFYMIPEVIELFYGGMVEKIESGDWN